MTKEQQESIDKYFSRKVALSSGSQQQDSQKHILLIGGVAILMVFALIMTN